MNQTGNTMMSELTSSTISSESSTHAPLNSTNLSSNNNMIVAVRIRPVSSAEESQGEQRCVQSLGKASNIVSIRKTGDTTAYLKSQANDSINDFAFDHVFDESSTQAEVYEQAVQKQLIHFLDGQHVTMYNPFYLLFSHDTLTNVLSFMLLDLLMVRQEQARRIQSLVVPSQQMHSTVLMTVKLDSSHAAWLMSVTSLMKESHAVVQAKHFPCPFLLLRCIMIKCMTCWGLTAAKHCHCAKIPHRASFKSPE
jgi:hypothetical protein